MSGCDTARSLIERHRDAVEALAQQLIDVESVGGDEVRALIAPR